MQVRIGWTEKWDNARQNQPVMTPSRSGRPRRQVSSVPSRSTTKTTSGTPAKRPCSSSACGNSWPVWRSRSPPNKRTPRGAKNQFGLSSEDAILWELVRHFPCTLDTQGVNRFGLSSGFLIRLKIISSVHSLPLISSISLKNNNAPC